MKNTASVKTTILIIICMLFLQGCTEKKKTEIVSKDEFLLDTIITITLYNPEDEKIFDELFNDIRNYEKLLSSHIENSDVNLINKNSGYAHIKVSSDTINIIKKSMDYSKLSDGKFDITAGTLINLWKIGTIDAAVPAPEDIETAKKLINYKDISIIDDTVMLNKKGMRLDLGAIAKGYIAEMIAEKIVSKKIKSGIVNLGGNVVLIGAKPNGSRYKVGIQDPDKERGVSFGIYTGNDKAIVTSGVYERFFIDNGIRYHHILDVNTGYPAENDIKSVSIITENAFDADALSTTVFLLGLDEGIKLLNNIPNCDGIFVTKKNLVYLTKDIKNSFEITNNDFKLAEN